MPDIPRCPVCDGEMVERYGKYGRFLGCVGYPACEGAREIPGSPRVAGVRSWRRDLVTGTICITVLAAVLLTIHFTMREPGGDERRVDAGDATRSVMSLDETRAYAAALGDADLPVCPRCGKKMAVRTNNASGEPFFGCSQFPRCRGTRDVKYPR